MTRYLRTSTTWQTPSNVDVEVDGRTVEFDLYGEAAVTYRVTASDTAGSYVYSGDLVDDQGEPACHRRSF